MKDLLRFLFLGEVGRVFHVRRVRVSRKKSGENPPSPPPPPTFLDSTKSKLIVIVTWVLSLVLIVCVLGTFILPALGEEVPNSIPQVITGIIGYFGGVICAFFGVQPTSSR